jgi:microcystin-dependent protein
MATIDDFGDVAEPLSAPTLGGPSGWAAAVRDAINALQALVSDVVPIGGIIMWSGTTAPPRYAICDGTNGTPNLSGKFVLSHGDGKAIGATGGAATHTLTSAEMPSHTHTQAAHTHTQAAHSHRFGYTTGPGTLESAPYTAFAPMSYNPGNQFSDTGSATPTVNSATPTNNPTGSGGAHNNMPPYYVLAYIQRKS